MVVTSTDTRSADLLQEQENWVIAGPMICWSKQICLYSSPRKTVAGSLAPGWLSAIRHTRMETNAISITSQYVLVLTASNIHLST